MPVAILVAGIIIAAAIIYAVGWRATPGSQGQTAQVEETLGGDEAAALKKMRPISDKDHILGDAKAPVKIVEYSDTECPFCKRFHNTVHQAVTDYPGQVAWVYRHFPLDALHSKARKEAEATECAAELAGNDGFWKYIDRLFELTPSNNGLDPAQLPQIAVDVGLDKAKFEECLASGRHASTVEEDVQDALATGGQGTPNSIIITASGEKISFSGAQPYEALKQVIDLALRAK